MHSHIGCICAISRHNEFSYAVSNCFHEQMHSHIGCICVISHQSEFWYVASNCLNEQMQSHIGCICTIFLQNEFSHVSLSGLSSQKHNHIGCMSFAFLFVFFLTNCWMFHKMMCSCWWQNCDCLTFVIHANDKQNFYFLSKHFYWRSV